MRCNLVRRAGDGEIAQQTAGLRSAMREAGRRQQSSRLRFRNSKRWSRRGQLQPQERRGHSAPAQRQDDSSRCASIPSGSAVIGWSSRRDSCKVPVEISVEPEQADAVIALKTLYRRQPERLRGAASERKPIYVLRANSVAQMQQALTRIFDLRESESGLSAGTLEHPTLRAMQEAEEAAHGLLNRGIGEVALAPQNAYVRRIQHQIANRYNLESRSFGKEPYRRVQSTRGSAHHLSQFRGQGHRWPAPAFRLR